ncbi:MAG TPA: hypothetical protein VF250_09260 [Conexibacter sp.]
MTGRAARTQDCSAAEARGRLAKARKFLEVAELVHEIAEEGDDESASVSAALFVLAGIAAADAACCHVLGRRSRAQDHRAAEDLVTGILPGGPQAAISLRRLLNLKDEAHYGFYAVGGSKLRAASRQARTVVNFADAAMRP